MTFTEKERQWFKTFSREEQIERGRGGVVVFTLLYLGFAFLFFYPSTLGPEDMMQFEGEVEWVKMSAYKSSRSETSNQLLIKLKHLNYPIPYNWGNYQHLSQLQTRIRRAKRITLFLREDAFKELIDSSSLTTPTYLTIDGAVILSLDEARGRDLYVMWFILGLGLFHILFSLLFWKAEAIHALLHKWTNKGKPESLVDVYTQKFRDYSRERLVEVAEGENRQPEAREAARRLLELLEEDSLIP